MTRWIWVAAAVALAGCVAETTEATPEPEPQVDAQGVGGGADGSAGADLGDTVDAGEPVDATVFVDAMVEPDAGTVDAQVPDPDGGRPDPCGLCAPFRACNYPLSDRECVTLCQDAPRELRACIQGAGRACDALGACFDDAPGPPPVEQQCRQACERQAQCINLSCAPGALTEGFQAACVEACFREPYDPETLMQLFGPRCDEVTALVRGWYPEVDARCDNDPEAVCELLCRDRIAPCDPAVDVAACAADCRDTWTDANLQCVQFTPRCAARLACFGDPEGQALCARSCGRIQGCLEEACPPRIIPPSLSTNCTAGCLADPPTAAEVEFVEAATCGEVRQLVYRNNRELAPLCEGGREFRPSADECAAFCDNVLQECLGFGDRNFCLAGCASLTRDEYGCALEAQGDCGGVNACISGD